MASPRTPHVFRPMRNTALGPSFQGLHTESSPMHPPVFDKTPNLSHSSRTASVDGTEHVTQWWEVSQQLRDAGIKIWLPLISTPMYHLLCLTRHQSIEPTKKNQYTDEDLSYLISHALSDARPLPHPMEKFKPMITTHEKLAFKLRLTACASSPQKQCCTSVYSPIFHF